MLTFKLKQTVSCVKWNSHNVKHYPWRLLWRLLNTCTPTQSSLGVPPILSTIQRVPSDPSFIQLNPKTVTYNRFTLIWIHLNSHTPANFLIISSIHCTKQQHLTFRPKQRVLVPSNHFWTSLNTSSYVPLPIPFSLHHQNNLGQHLSWETSRVSVPSSWIP